MPIRDVEWFSAPQQFAPRVLANRGANGIDGVVSSVLGAAVVTRGRTVGLIGDLAFFHDLSGLVWGTKEEMPNATFVVVDNRGGGIFSFLAYPSFVDGATFERGFGTPQRQSIAESAQGLGCLVTEVDSIQSLRDAIEASATAPGISVIVATTDRDENVARHGEISAAVRRHASHVSAE
jgi:2-succinyl-5-enolpyruvyl-6-hydroxy-3-cyclohexene-1-carboxylate synthase